MSLLSQKEYEYSAICNVPPIIKFGDRFSLDDGYYTNETETVLLKSTNYTGRIIKKLSPSSKVEPKTMIAADQDATCSEYKEPDSVLPYSIGDVVYRLKSSGEVIEEPGKIISVEDSINFPYKYRVYFLGFGEDCLDHNSLIPAKLAFDLEATYSLTMSLSPLANKGDMFLERNGFLYNRQHTLIVAVNEFKPYFKNVSLQKTINQTKNL